MSKNLNLVFQSIERLLDRLENEDGSWLVFFLKKKKKKELVHV